MTTETIHPKIKELKLRATPVTSSLAVNAKGELMDDNTIKGYLVAWNVVDSYGTIFLKGCCAKSIQERGPESNSKYKITMLWQHDQRDPIGQFTVLKEDDYGLYFEARVDDVPNGLRAVKQIRSGTINQFSIGFDFLWDKMEYNEELDAIVLKEIDLFEGSAVTIGANSQTYAIRSVENLEAEKELLQDETEDFIRSIPRKQQLELRQLITRHISLAKFKPDELRQTPLETRAEPVEAGLDYTYLTQNLKLF